jgi:anti-sigma factor RsiW
MSDQRNSNVIIWPECRTRSPIAALRQLHARLRRRRASLTLPAEPTISDYELHAFVDDALDPARHERVQLFLARHPSVAADAAAYRQQNRLLRELRRERPPSPPSPAVGYLTTRFACRLALARGGRILAWSAAAAVLVAAVASVLEGVDIAIVPHVILTAGR